MGDGEEDKKARKQLRYVLRVSVSFGLSGTGTASVIPLPASEPVVTVSCTWLQSVSLRSWLLRGQLDGQRPTAVLGTVRVCIWDMGRWDCIKSGKMAKFGLGKVIVASIAGAIASFSHVLIFSPSAAHFLTRLLNCLG